MKFAVALVPLLFGLLAILLEQDANWDLRNYHWYNAYAFVNDRLDFDVGAAQVATYYNPLLDLPFYWLATRVPARVAGFALGVVQGLNFALLYLLALQLRAPRLSRVAAFGLAAVGMLGGGNLGLIGTTFCDNIISLPLLAALLIVLAWGGVRQTAGDAGRPWALPLAGLLAGGAVGLKLPAAVFAVGLCGGLLALAGRPRARVLRALVFGIAVLLGIGVTAGAWYLRVWHAFGNPIFPYFNDVIESPLALPVTYRDPRFLPAGLWRTLLFPLVLSRDPLATGEVYFRDFRIAAAFVLLLAAALTALLRRRTGKPASTPADRANVYLVATCALAYSAWLALFAIYRYAIALEMLAPLLIVIATRALALPRRFGRILCGAVLMAVSVTARPANWTRVPWSEHAAARFVTVAPPLVPNPAATLIVMTGFGATAFAIPAFPREIPFLRIQSYLVNPLDGATGLNRVMAERIAAHRGDLFWLGWHRELADGEDALASYGLAAAASGCETVRNNLTRGIELCRLKRIEPTPIAPPAIEG